MPTSRRRSPGNDQDSPWSSRTIEFAVCVERTEEECSRVLLAECAQGKAKDRRNVAGDAAMLAGSPVANACAGQRLSWPWRWLSLKAGPAFHDVGQLAPFEAVCSIAPGPIFRNNSDRVAPPWREASGLGFSMMNWLYERDSKTEYLQFETWTSYVRRILLEIVERRNGEAGVSASTAQVRHAPQSRSTAVNTPAVSRD